MPSELADTQSKSASTMCAANDSLLLYKGVLT